MRDRRDYVLAAPAAGLLFLLGIVVGRHAGVSVLPAAEAQDAVNPNPVGVGSGVTISTSPTPRQARTAAQTASDSNSNNRFVAVTCPIGSGESVLFLLDSESEQIATYRFERRKGLEFLAARKIDYDLKITGYQDISKYSRDEIRREYEKDRARAAAEAAKAGK
jgi:hypothetical protein